MPARVFSLLRTGVLVDGKREGVAVRIDRPEVILRLSVNTLRRVSTCSASSGGESKTIRPEYFIAGAFGLLAVRLFTSASAGQILFDLPDSSRH